MLCVLLDTLLSWRAEILDGNVNVYNMFFLCCLIFSLKICIIQLGMK
jgi:hypothetical protein